NYAMVGPENETQYAGANYHEINFHRSFDWTDFFTDEQGSIDQQFPSVKWLIGFTGVEEGTKLTVNIHFNSEADMKKILDLGFEEGFKAALAQLEELVKQKD
ncbi:MAG: SRPBCC family protein, partial [Kaistella sp.]